MAGSNSPFSSGGVSSILKSAQSTANKIAEYQDAIAAFEYQNSAHTDSAFATYQAYLKKRIGGLQGGDLSSQQKALSLTKTLESAYHANVSANIQRENIQVMAGNATLRDKYNLVAGQFSKAVGNGDYTLAQSLESQAYSISQQIQYQEQQAQDAAETLAKANATANARGEANLADSLKQSLEKFNADYSHAGQKTFDKLAGDFVKQITPTLNAMGIYLPQGAAPNYFDIVEGVNRAIYKSYTLAGDAVAPYATDGGQSFYDKASAVVDKVPTVYGDMSAQELADAQANPGQFSYNEAPDFTKQTSGGVGGTRNPQTGYQIQKGGVAPSFAGSPWIDVPNSFVQTIQKLGLNVVGQSMNGGAAYTVSASKNSPDAIKKILPGNATTVATANVTTDENGNTVSTTGAPSISFEADSVSGQGKAVYTVTSDQSGRHAIYESSALGDKLLSQDTGYDTTFAPNARDYNNTRAHPSFFSRLGDAFKSGVTNFGSFFGGGNPHMQIQQAQREQVNMAASKLVRNPSLPALPIAKPPVLPQLSVAQPKPLPNITVAKPKPLPVTPKTVNPQPASTLSVQGSSSASLLQGGSGGIRLQ